MDHDIPDDGTRPGEVIKLPARAAFEAADDAHWKDKIKSEFIRKGDRPISSSSNVLKVLQGDPRWRGLIKLDEFAKRITKARPAPWGGLAGEWTDEDDMRLTVWLELEYALRCEPRDLQNGLAWEADRNKVHAVREYLEECAEKWDRTARLEGWLMRYLAADALPDDDPGDVDQVVEYYRRIGVKWCVAAVARIMLPGCRVDNMLILEGAEGKGKSTVFRVLGGPFFTDALLNPNDKEYNAIISGKWIVEMPELETLNKSEGSTMRRFLTQHTDRYRSWYGRRAGDVPRQCVFGGTVNDATYIKDLTGGRRYWPVFATSIDMDALTEDRSQLWGEAVHLFRASVPWWETAEDVELFRAQQDKRVQRDPYEAKIGAWLRAPGNCGDETTTLQIMEDCLKLDPPRMTRAEEIRIGMVMQRLRWVRTRKRLDADGDRAYVYRRPME